MPPTTAWQEWNYTPSHATKKRKQKTDRREVKLRVSDKGKRQTIGFSFSKDHKKKKKKPYINVIIFSGIDIREF